MSGSFSDYAELKVLEHIVGKTSFTMPSTWIALVTTLPTDASIGSTLVEPSGNGYVRLATSGAWGSAAAGAIANSSALTFATASGAGWCAILGFALCDASATGTGNVLAWGSLTTKTILAGDTASFAIGDLSITLD